GDVGLHVTLLAGQAAIDGEAASEGLAVEAARLEAGADRGGDLARRELEQRPVQHELRASDLAHAPRPVLLLVEEAVDRERTERVYRRVEAVDRRLDAGEVEVVVGQGLAQRAVVIAGEGPAPG